MSPMRYYLYCKLDIILSKTGGFTVFSMRMSICQPSVLWVTSSVFVAHSGAFDWHNTFVIKYFNLAMFLFQLVSVLLVLHSTHI